MVTFWGDYHWSLGPPWYLLPASLSNSSSQILNLPTAYHPGQTVAPGRQEWQIILSWSLSITTVFNVAGYTALPEHPPLH